MSVTAVISYNSLKDAASEAKQVASRLDRYADNLNRDVYNKLNNYRGNYSGNIAAAKSKTNAKITELRNKSRAYTNYANDLYELKEKCESTDKSVKSMVSQLTASFKEAHEIRNSVIENTINYFLTSLKNSTLAGRWLNNTSDKAKSIKEYIKKGIKDWWDYEGGKELIKGQVAALLEIAEGICDICLGIAAIAALIVTGGTIWAAIVAVAGIVGGVITLGNGITNYINEERAYYETNKNKDPALGRRRSDEDTFQDVLRRETDSQFLHNIATGIDITKIVCDVIDFVDGIWNMAKKAYKWTTGSEVDIKNLTRRDVLTKNNFSAFIGNIKTTLKKGILNIGKAIKGGFTGITNYAKKLSIHFIDDFMNNMKEFKKGYTNFSNFEDGTETAKKWISITEKLVSGDFADIFLNKILFPNIKILGDISVGDIVGNISKISKIFGNIFDKEEGIWKNIFHPSNSIDKNLLNKLSSFCNVSISIPKIYIPKISVGAA